MHTHMNNHFHITLGIEVTDPQIWVSLLSVYYKKERKGKNTKKQIIEQEEMESVPLVDSFFWLLCFLFGLLVGSNTPESFKRCSSLCIVDEVEERKTKSEQTKSVLKLLLLLLLVLLF